MRCYGLERLFRLPVRDCGQQIKLTAMSFDDNIDELTIAASLHEKLYNKPLRLTKLPNGIEVPASAEYVFWGKITLDLSLIHI